MDNIKIEDPLDNIIIKKKITIEDLYNIFFKKELLNLYLDNQPIVSTPIKKVPLPLNLTPFSKIILDHTSPNSKEYMLKELIKDNEKLKSLELNDDDPDYLNKIENNYLGFFMEDFISINGLCPVCNQPTLRKYSSSTIPVIDLICINYYYHLIQNECFIFQVKISLNNSYFNLKNKNISVGSKRFGEIAHSINGIDLLKNKFIVPGYICLQLTDLSNRSYLINYSKSFILIPNYMNELDQPYYSYVKKNFFNKDVITWNSKLVDIVDINNCIKNINQIDYTLYLSQQLINPYFYFNY